MTPESITVSLDMARLLKEAGWDQKTYFSWWIQKYGDYCTEPHIERTSFSAVNFDWNQHSRIPAPTAEEILRELPNDIKIDGKMACLEILSDRDVYNEGWVCCYSFGQNCDNEYWRKCRDLSDSCAAMYCYLAENNLLPSR